MTRIVGAVHGRFQPFHNGHLEYVLAAMQRCEFLLIGITQYDRGIVDADSPEHRLNLEENPFSYWERTVLITSALMNLKIESDRYSFVPFPIHDPARISEYVPNNVEMFTTVYDEWNREKVARLKAEGYEVTVLWERQKKQYEGRLVRSQISENDPKLSQTVPKGTFEALQSLLDMKGTGIL